MRKFLRGMFVLVAIVALSANVSFAQDEITDQDLKDYAVIELAKESILRSIGPWVQSYIEKYNDAQSAPENKISGDRWKELDATKGDDAKLAALEANVGEIDITKKIHARINKKKKAAGDVVKLLASNGLGASKYKAVKAALKSDDAVKAKYQAILDGFNG